jgi:hypothetical protein
LEKLELAEENYIESIKHSKLNQDTTQWIASLSSLALMYRSSRTGKKEKLPYKNVEPFYIEFLDQYKTAKLQNTTMHIERLRDLASFNKFVKRYQEAEKLYLEVLGVCEKSLGKRNIEYIVSLRNLGDLYREMDQPKMSEMYYKESREIGKKTGWSK